MIRFPVLPFAAAGDLVDFTPPSCRLQVSEIITLAVKGWLRSATNDAVILVRRLSTPSGAHGSDIPRPDQTVPTNVPARVDVLVSMRLRVLHTCHTTTS